MSKSAKFGFVNRLKTALDRAKEIDRKDEVHDRDLPNKGSVAEIC